MRPEKKSLKFGFVCDPLDSFNPEAETSLFLMRELFARGHKIFTCEPKDIFLKQKEVWATVKQISLGTFPKRGTSPFYQILDQSSFPLAKLDCLFLRKDPPFDLKYLFHLWQLSFLEGKVLMVNPPSAILKNNEKLSALNFPFAPKTWVGSDIEGLKGWAKAFKNGVVVKPLNEGGGRGVRWIKKSEIRNPKSEKRLLQLTQNQTQPILAQEFLPAVCSGDKRVLLWNGRILGAFLRRPTKKGEFRANLHLGGQFYKTKLSTREKKIAKSVAAWTKKERLYFTGLDLVGEKLTEINVTSPMGIRELNVLYGVRIEDEMIDSIV